MNKGIMKKISFLMLCLLTVNVTMGQDRKTHKTIAKSKKTTSTPKAASISKAYYSKALIPIPFGDITVHLPLLYPGALDVQTAISYINNYNGSTQKIASQLSFAFDAASLLTYIQTNNSTIVNFLLGQDNGGKLYLLIAPIDNKGKHYYFDDGTVGSPCYVINSSTDQGLSTTLEDPGSYDINTYYIEAMKKSDAQTMINNYQTYINQPINVSAKLQNNGWLYNGTDLAGYIIAAQTKGIKYLQFLLANNTSYGTPIVDLILAGVNNASKHMYFEYNNDASVMENCKPCPTCASYNDGRSLEPNCN